MSDPTAALTSSAAQSAVPNLFPKRVTPTPAQIETNVRRALDVQRRAVTFGKRPFAAILVAPDNETVLLMHQSIDQVNHAEVSLRRERSGEMRDGEDVADCI